MLPRDARPCQQSRSEKLAVPCGDARRRRHQGRGDRDSARQNAIVETFPEAGKHQGLDNGCACGHPAGQDMLHARIVLRNIDNGDITRGDQARVRQKCDCRGTGLRLLGRKGNALAAQVCQLADGPDSATIAPPRWGLPGVPVDDTQRREPLSA